ncbi:MAG: Sapep family Mn(2+)-dependent dipeptidase [Oscillospiraceae bacterium]|nr:Sapep family Mn(2+)-dependent dipeptidase [Oscillospiraceae bacterium]
MTIQEKISRWVDSQRDNYLRDVSRLVAIRSVGGEGKEGMPFGEGPAAALAEAMKIAAEHSFLTKDYDGYVMTADLLEGERALDILAHLDVVGEGDGWETDPYTAVEKDGCLYGRGTDDDKGPAVAAMYAMTCVRAVAGSELKKNVRLILGTDEESGSRDIRYYYAREKSAPYTFSPDASFPVFNTEKGGFVGSFRKDWESCTALPRVIGFDGGYRINVLPADASAKVRGLTKAEIELICMPLASEMGVTLTVTEEDGAVRMAVRGLAAHASTPEQGRNGIAALIALLNALPLAACPAADALGALGRLMPYGDGEGKALGIAMEDDISGPLTLAFSLFKLTEEGCEGSFDSRVPLCAGEENCRAVAEKRFTDAGFTFQGGMRPPHHTPGDTPFVAAMLRSYEAYSGRKGECLSMGGGTYVHDIPGGVAFGAAMPDFESNLHSANERMNIADMLTAIKIFAQVIYDLCT